MSTTKLTADELAELLEVDKRKIYRLVASGKITPVRDLAGRLFFHPEQVQRDYQRARVELPAPMAAYIRKPWVIGSKPRAELARREERGAA